PDALDELADLFASVRFHDRCNDVGTALQPAVRLAEHGAGLADTRCCTKVDAQVAAPMRLRQVAERVVLVIPLRGTQLNGARHRWRPRLLGGGHTDIISPGRSRFTREIAVQLQIERQYVGGWLAEEAEQAIVLVVTHRGPDLRGTDPAGAGHPRHLNVGVRRG